MGAVLGALFARSASQEGINETLAYFRSSPLLGRGRRWRRDGLQVRSGPLGRLARKFATALVAVAVSFRLGLRRYNPVEAAVEHFFPGLDFDITSLSLPFACNALDLGEGVVAEFSQGPLNPALKAGIAVGLVFKPYRWLGKHYVDAAPLSPVPVGLCRRLGAPRVLGVDISSPLEKGIGVESGFEVVRRIMSVQSTELNRQETAGADWLIQADLGDFFWADFDRLDELVERGRQAVEPLLAQAQAPAKPGFPRLVPELPKG
jgi:predicted acylesterase/phospholipase RssA